MKTKFKLLRLTMCLAMLAGSLCYAVADTYFPQATFTSTSSINMGTTYQSRITPVGASQAMQEAESFNSISSGPRKRPGTGSTDPTNPDILEDNNGPIGEPIAILLILVALYTGWRRVRLNKTKETEI